MFNGKIRLDDKILRKINCFGKKTHKHTHTLTKKKNDKIEKLEKRK